MAREAEDGGLPSSHFFQFHPEKEEEFVARIIRAESLSKRSAHSITTDIRYFDLDRQEKKGGIVSRSAQPGLSLGSSGSMTGCGGGAVVTSAADVAASAICLVKMSGEWWSSGHKCSRRCSRLFVG